MTLALYQYNYDDVLLTKTQLASQNGLNPPLGVACSQYTGVWCDHNRKKGGDVLLLVKNYLSCNLIFYESAADMYELLACDVRHHSDLFRIVGVSSTNL